MRCCYCISRSAKVSHPIEEEGAQEQPPGHLEEVCMPLIPGTASLAESDSEVSSSFADHSDSEASSWMSPLERQPNNEEHPSQEEMVPGTL